MLSLSQRKKTLASLNRTDMTDFILRKVLCSENENDKEIITRCPVLSRIFTKVRLLSVVDQNRARNYLYRKLLSDKVLGCHFLYHYHDSYFNTGGKSTYKKRIIETFSCKIAIHFFDDPYFDFTRLPLKEVKSSRKNNTIFLKILGNCSRTGWITAREKRSSDISVKIKHLTSGNILFLLYEYRIRRYYYYRGRGSSSNYYRYYLLVFDLSDHRYVFFGVKNRIKPEMLHEEDLPRNIMMFLTNLSGKYQTNIQDKKELRAFLKKIKSNLPHANPEHSTSIACVAP